MYYEFNYLVKSIHFLWQKLILSTSEACILFNPIYYGFALIMRLVCTLSNYAYSIETLKWLNRIIERVRVKNSGNLKIGPLLLNWLKPYSKKKKVWDAMDRTRLKPTTTSQIKKRRKIMLLHRKSSNKKSTWTYISTLLEIVTHINNGRSYDKFASN